MKKIIISAIALIAFSNGAFATEKVYGQLFMTTTEKALEVDRGLVGVQAGLGGSATADVAYDAATNSVQTAKVAYGGLLGGDSLSVGLQASAYDAALDTELGMSALSCFSCVHHKSAIYTNQGLSLQVNENNNYAASLQYTLAPQLTLVVGGEYDHPTDHLLGKAAALVTVGPVKAVADAVVHDSTCDYGLAGSVNLYKMVGAFGKYARGGGLTVGPTLSPTDGLMVAVVAERPLAGADYDYAAKVSANF